MMGRAPQRISSFAFSLFALVHLASSITDATQTPKFAAAPSTGQKVLISGQGRALTGDTLEISGKKIALFGMNAPSPEGVSGRFARAYLDDLVRSKVVICSLTEPPTSPQTTSTGRCSIGNLDLAREMVRAGWASVNPHRTTEYDTIEQQARYKGLGLWKSMPKPDGDSDGLFDKLRQFQASISAIIVALLALAGVVFRDSLRSRRSGKREAVERQRDAINFARSLSREIRSFTKRCRDRRIALLKAIDDGRRDWDTTEIRSDFISFPPADYYDQNIDKVGLLVGVEREQLSIEVDIFFTTLEGMKVKFFSVSDGGPKLNISQIRQIADEIPKIEDFGEGLSKKLQLMARESLASSPDYSP